MGYDGKYGKVTTEHGDIPDDEPVIVFRARDLMTKALLERYDSLCREAGSPQRHLDLIEKTYNTFLDWQRDNPGKVRVPDSERSRGWLSQ
jgi:hypothetical protein